MIINIYLKIKHHLANLIYSYSSLLFIKSKIVGIILFLGTLMNINLAFAGVLSWAITYRFARFIGIKREDIIHSVFSYNSLLTGFAIGFMFKISLLSVLLTIGGSIFTFLLSYFLSNLFYTYFKLPILNVPYTIAGTFVYLASTRYSNLFVDSFYPQTHLNLDQHLTPLIQGLLKSAGVMVFLPYDIVGIFVLAAILIFSRITFFLTITSYYFGIFLLTLFKGGVNIAVAETATFNFILIGIALGSVFLIPSRRSYILSFVGVAISVIIIDAVSVFWTSFRIPVFTLPFNLVVLLFLYVLNSVKYKYISNLIMDSPEKTLSYYLGMDKRYDLKYPAPGLPYIGNWNVYQDFDGEWTHKGHWKYAYDFVIRDDEGKTYKNEGKLVDDYYCFGKPVISPISGYVVETVDKLPDNKIGDVDHKNNWGNYIIIKSVFEYYVEISHLKSGSIRCKTGDFLEKGELLGLCGNSGYSPEPHIHMQVQYSPRIGSETFFFYINSAVRNDGKQFNRVVLKKDEVYSTGIASKRNDKRLQFILDDEFSYEVVINGKKTGEVKFIVNMDEDGSYFFNEGDNYLYFGIDGDRFIFYNYFGNNFSILGVLFRSCSYIPLTEFTNLEWQDYMPDYIMKKRLGHMFFKSFNFMKKECFGFYKGLDKDTIYGEIKTNNSVLSTSKTVLDDLKGFSSIEFSDSKSEIIYRRM
ncbi:MAG: urea transporter [Candidatus Delongbacteria bacterium]|nr:urea transporter [Candidatus Delongbacteria bacterium]MBN2834852.1 urea transporter [Candidatus Delongbacteria bacterium]